MNGQKTATLPRKRAISLTQEVMNDLAARIRGGQYKPGDKLPTEPEVMAQQGVSRTVVREAMSRLQAAGLVETRHGVGTFVLQPTSTPPALDLTTAVTIRDVLAMLELRISLETEAAGLAAMRRNDAQLADWAAMLERTADGDAWLRTPFLYTESTGARTTTLAGTWRHRLRQTPEGLRIVLKRVNLVNAHSRLPMIQLFP